MCSRVFQETKGPNEVRQDVDRRSSISILFSIYCTAIPVRSVSWASDSFTSIAISVRQCHIEVTVA